MRFAILLGLALVVSGCEGRSSGSVPPPGPPGGEGAESAAYQARRALVERGRRIYMSHCIACHNMDPRRNGAVGPANSGSSRELIEARVLRGEYPPGYVPKRDSKVMPSFPHLAPEIDALAAYLASTGGGAEAAGG